MAGKAPAFQFYPNDGKENAMSDKSVRLRALFDAPIQFGNHEQAELLRNLAKPCECGGDSPVAILDCGSLACQPCCERCSWDNEECEHFAGENGYD